MAGMLRASQTCESDVGVRRVAAGAGGRRDRPFVAGPPARLRGAPVGHQAGLAHALQMDAHAVGVQSQPLGQLDGGGGAAELPEEREQPSTRRLGERVVVPAGLGEVNTSQFSHLAVRNRRCMVGCRRLSGEAAVR